MSDEEEINTVEIRKQEELRELKHERGILKSKLTRFEAFIRVPENYVKLAQIETRLKGMETDFQNFNTVQSRLEYLEPIEGEQREVIEERYYDSIARAKDLLWQGLNKAATPSTPLVAARDESGLASGRISVQLPDVPLPVFYGTIETWKSFLDVFNSCVDNRKDLTDAQKFIYLRGCCKGAAFKVIERYDVADESYKEAIRVLKDRFENRRQLVVHHVKGLLFNLPEVTKQSHTNLRNLLDTVTHHISVLEKLNIQTQAWDILLVQLILKKLDRYTRQEWDNLQDEDGLPTLERLKGFLVKKCSRLEESFNEKVEIQKENSSFKSNVKHNTEIKDMDKKNRFVSQSYVVTKFNKCRLCNNESHFLYQCSEFLKLSIEQKLEKVRELKVCSNCLRFGHYKFQCKSSGCKKCGNKHNTSLHVSDENKHVHSRVEENNSHHDTTVSNHSYIPSESKESSSRISDNQIINLAKICQVSNNNSSQVLLSTATVLIQDNTGNLVKCTALLDSGSQSNLITETFSNKLKLYRENTLIPIVGIGQTKTKIKYKVETNIKSRLSKFNAHLEFLVIPKITEKLPVTDFNSDLIKIPSSIKLADVEFNKPKEVDILLGAEIFYDILQNGKLKLSEHGPVLIETHFGWILTGRIINSELVSNKVCNFNHNISNEQLDMELTKFWQLDEIPQVKSLSLEDSFCEEYFKDTTTQTREGRFIVRLPFAHLLDKNVEIELGDSKAAALRRFLSIETRLKRDKELFKNYFEFMNEYEKLSHMNFSGYFENIDGPKNISYFMPHHPVIRESSLTTKCRVVFDASQKSNNGLSLNDILLTGPYIQDELFSIVLRLRLRPIVLSADIKMMFRQILVAPEDRKYQQILWRSNSDEPIKVFELATVTYGTSCAPFLATRCLVELAHRFQNKYPRTCKVILNSFYMDDLLVSIQTHQEAMEIVHELTEILGSAGFLLRKWTSNKDSLVNEIVNMDSDIENLVMRPETKELKTLGIAWIPEQDALLYSINIEFDNAYVTKRAILSAIAKIYDPLGLIGPVVIKAKIIVQSLWLLKLHWDEILPPELHDQWFQFYYQLKTLQNFEVPRQVICSHPVTIEMHGFSDASEKAYGACIYMCSEDSNGQRYSRLLCAKSKVAPIKRVTMPRLELLAAHLLSKLINTVKRSLDVSICKTVYYSDSTIVLAWLRINPIQLKTFVANRVTNITNLTNVDDWQHVTSENNPADLISRGTDPRTLTDCNLWWIGPTFLRKIQENPKDLNLPNKVDLPELKSNIISLVSRKNENEFSNELFKRYSSFTKLIRVVGYIYRFFNVLKWGKRFSDLSLTTDEMKMAKSNLIRLAQRNHYSQESDCLNSNKNICSRSPILNLAPFLDSDGILRVAGRLKNSFLDYNAKHPIILPRDDPLTYLIIKEQHLRNLHAGAQNLLSIIRLQYWPVHGKNLVKKVIKQCIVCFKVKPKPAGYLMGQLPTSRVIPTRPFNQCGVDYAGPILVREGTLRNSKLVKSYICVFVCFTTRAVHIELVLDLTTDGFLNALKRFISRRGKPYIIHSDNGGNFQGANNYFVELFNLLNNKTHNEKIHNFLVNNEIKWSFIPARSPHMGGLWEAAVKSLKFHLRRILGESLVRFDELHTILTQIEACLNSRPLVPISQDPNDYLPLTPAHFLVGESLLAMPQIPEDNVNSNRLTRFHRIQQLYQQFWKAWSRDYLSSLQKRSKWKKDIANQCKVDSLVILVEEDTPPLRWPMARITEFHQGKDGVSRVVSVRLSSGKIVKRAINKICPLPDIESEL